MAVNSVDDALDAIRQLKLQFQQTRNSPPPLTEHSSKLPLPHAPSGIPSLLHALHLPNTRRSAPPQIHPKLPKIDLKNALESIRRNHENQMKRAAENKKKKPTNFSSLDFNLVDRFQSNTNVKEKDTSMKSLFESTDDLNMNSTGSDFLSGFVGSSASTEQKPKIVKQKAKKINIHAVQSLSHLCQTMGVKGIEALRLLRQFDGRARTLQSYINGDLAEYLCVELGWEPVMDSAKQTEINDDEKEKWPRRAPVVCVMGHVDHGKTTLLDRLRKTNVVAQEAGGITQSIGAFPVKLCDETATDGTNMATFLDTPGHSAFKNMRQRGAQGGCTDVIVLVVSVVDGIQPQTLEVINLAERNKVPMVVALNKCDVDGADATRIKRELQTYNIVSEEAGGDTLMVEISALKGDGIPELIEAITLTADLLDLKAPDHGPGKAYIVESRMDPGGVLVNTVVRSGVIKVGDAFLCGAQYGKIRALIDCEGKSIQTAGPSTPVQILGFSSLEDASSEVLIVKDEARAKEIIAENQKEKEAQELIERQEAEVVEEKEEGQVFRHKVGRKMVVGVKQLDESEKQALKDEEKKVVPAILKCDVNGSLEALQEYIRLLPIDQVRLEIVGTSLGDITPSDLDFASTLKARIFGFNVSASPSVVSEAKKKGVEVETHNIIYQIFDFIRDALSDRLPRITEFKTTGKSEVLQMFPLNGKKRDKVMCAGLHVTSGELQVTKMFRVIRDGVILHVGGATSLRHFKENVSSIAKGQECGLVLEDFTGIECGDIIECGENVAVKQQLDDSIARGQDAPSAQRMTIQPKRK